MRLLPEYMHKSGTIDLVALLSAVEAVKRALDPDNVNDYSVLVFENNYFITKYMQWFKDDDKPTLWNLLKFSDFMFKIHHDEVAILKNRRTAQEITPIFESRGIKVYNNTPQYVDEE